MREGRLEHDLGQEVEPETQVFLEHGQRDRRAVAAGVTLEAAPHELDGPVELGPRPFQRAASQKIGGEIGQARRVRRIKGGAGPDVEPHHHDGNGRALGHEQHRALSEDFAMHLLEDV